MVGRQAEEDENATEAVGRIGYEAVTGHDPDAELKAKLGNAVHWGYSPFLGAVYGALRNDGAATASATQALRRVM